MCLFWCLWDWGCRFRGVQAPERQSGVQHSTDGTAGVRCVNKKEKSLDQKVRERTSIWVIMRRRKEKKEEQTRDRGSFPYRQQARWMREQTPMELKKHNNKNRWGRNIKWRRNKAIWNRLRSGRGRWRPFRGAVVWKWLRWLSWMKDQTQHSWDTDETLEANQCLMLKQKKKWCW